MQKVKQKLQKFDQRPFKRWELYLQFAFPWFFAGLLALGGATLIEKIVAHEEPLILALVVAMIGYIVFGLGYTGVAHIRPFMDGIYQQYLKGYEERIAKAKTEDKEELKI